MCEPVSILSSFLSTDSSRLLISNFFLPFQLRVGFFFEGSLKGTSPLFVSLFSVASSFLPTNDVTSSFRESSLLIFSIARCIFGPHTSIYLRTEQLRPPFNASSTSNGLRSPSLDISDRSFPTLDVDTTSHLFFVTSRLGEPRFERGDLVIFVGFWEFFFSAV